MKQIKYFNDTSSYEISANQFNYSLIVKGKVFVDLITIDMDLKLSYYQINDDIVINNKFIDIYDIKKHVKTFTQRDDNIRMNIINTLCDEYMNNIIFIGGEMYLFAKILKYQKGVAFTSFEDIKQDTEDNNSIQTFLINYKKDNIIQYIDKLNINPNICVVNVLNGLGENLIKQLNSLNIDKLIIINCKLSVMESDIKLIKLNLTKIYKFITPFQQINLYVFTK